MRAKHTIIQPQERPIPPPWQLDVPNPPPEDFDALDVDAHDEGEGGRPEWEHHALLCGAFSPLCLTNTLTDSFS